MGWAGGLLEDKRIPTEPLSLVLCGRLVRLLLYRDSRPATTTSEDIQAQRSGAISRFIHTQIAPDNRIVLLQRGGGEAFILNFYQCLFIPHSVDPFITALSHCNSAFDMLCLLVFDPWP